MIYICNSSILECESGGSSQVKGNVYFTLKSMKLSNDILLNFQMFYLIIHERSFEITKPDYIIILIITKVKNKIYLTRILKVISYYTNA